METLRQILRTHRIGARHLPMSVGSEPPSGGFLLWEPASTMIKPVLEEIHVFAFGLDLPAPRIEALKRVLSPDEAARAERFKFRADRDRFIVGRAAIRTLLGSYLGEEARCLRFRYDLDGKAHLADIDSHGEIRFNFSGSHGLGLLAVQRHRDVGVDVERVRTLSVTSAVADIAFNEEERAVLDAQSGRDFDLTFFSLWTRKEALAKCLGRGLSHPMRSLSVAPIPTGSAERITVDGPDAPGVLWVVPLPDPCLGFLAAVASKAVPSEVRCFRWSAA